MTRDEKLKMLLEIQAEIEKQIEEINQFITSARLIDDKRAREEEIDQLLDARNKRKEKLEEIRERIREVMNE